MKSFRSYLVESEHTYKFRIKLANELSAETMDALETALEKYGVASISKPKKTPIQEHPMDFQTLNNAEVFIMDAEVKYPVTADQLYRYISEVVGVPASHLVVINSNNPEEFGREEAVKEIESDYEPLIGSQDELKQQEVFGDKYNENMLKSIETKKFEYAKTPGDVTKQDYSGPAREEPSKKSMMSDRGSTVAPPKPNLMASGGNNPL